MGSILEFILEVVFEAVVYELFSREKSRERSKLYQKVAGWDRPGLIARKVKLNAELKDLRRRLGGEVQLFSSC